MMTDNATLTDQRTDKSTTVFPPMADSIVSDLVNASGDPRNLMYPRTGRPNPTPGVHACVDADCGYARSTQPAYGDRPTGVPQMITLNFGEAMEPSSIG